MVGIVTDPSSSSMEKPGQPPHPFHRVKRLDRPNRAALDEQIAKIHQQIDAFQFRISEITAIIDNKQQNKHFASPELLDARKRLSELNASFSLHVEEKKALREELDLAGEMRDRMRADARSLREQLPYVNVVQIDEEIKKLEYRMSHTSLSIQEEKRIVSQIEGFKKSREFVRDYSERLEKINCDEGSRAELIGKIREKDQILNTLKAKQDEQRRILTLIREKEASQAFDIPALIQERSSNIGKIKDLREKVKEIRAEFRAKENEFWEREREWRSQQAMEKKLKAERRQAEWQEREELRMQKAMENYMEPYTNEITICDQLSAYLQKVAPVEDLQVSVAAEKIQIVAPKGFGGMIPRKKYRGDEDLEGWFGGLGSKGKSKKTKVLASTKSREKERLSLSLDALTSFEKVRVPPPTIIGDICKSLEDLRAKKESFLKLQKQAREGTKENGKSHAIVGESNGVVHETGGTSEDHLKGKIIETELSPESVSNEVTLSREGTKENGKSHAIVGESNGDVHEIGGISEDNLKRKINETELSPASESNDVTLSREGNKENGKSHATESNGVVHEIGATSEDNLRRKIIETELFQASESNDTTLRLEADDKAEEAISVSAQQKSELNDVTLGPETGDKAEEAISVSAQQKSESNDVTLGPETGDKAEEAISVSAQGGSESNNVTLGPEADDKAEEAISVSAQGGSESNNVTLGPEADDKAEEAISVSTQEKIETEIAEALSVSAQEKVETEVSVSIVSEELSAGSDLNEVTLGTEAEYKAEETVSLSADEKAETEMSPEEEKTEGDVLPEKGISSISEMADSEVLVPKENSD